MTRFFVAVLLFMLWLGGHTLAKHEGSPEVPLCVDLFELALSIGQEDPYGEADIPRVIWEIGSWCRE